MRQQTPEWLEFRRSKIGSSDAPIIMGVSPWCTPYQLWRRKLGLEPDAEVTPRMRRGIEMENEARIHFELMSGLQVEPKVVTSNEHPWMIASLDGITKDGRNALEIKCPGAEDHNMAENGKIPEKYIPQLQHQMAVAELDHIFYFSFDGKKGVEIKVYRNDEYIYDMISKEQEFYNNMCDLISPELCDRDYITHTEPEWVRAAIEWEEAKTKLKEMESKEKDLRERLISMSDGQNSICNGVRISHVTKKGAIDMDRLTKDFSFDIENYRKNSVEYWKLSIL